MASDLIPLRKWALWQGYSNLCYGVGAGLGGMFGGWVNDVWGWRWVFGSGACDGGVSDLGMVHGEDCGQAFRSGQQKQMAANRLHGSDHAHTGLGVAASGLESGG